MSKGEIPQIPEYLQESVRSAEAYEQDARRDFQISEWARKRQIPEASMQTNATVRRYVTVLRDGDAAQVRLGRPEMKEFVKEIDPLAHERIGQASQLYAGVRTILEEGFQAHLDGGVDLPVRPIDLDPMRGDSLTKRLHRAAEPFGLSVDVPEGWRQRRFLAITQGLEPHRPTPDPVGGVWTGAPFTAGQPEPWQRPDGRNDLWYWPDWPNERHDREHLQALGEEATRQGLDPERTRTDPVVHTLLTGIVYGRQLVAETEELSDLPPAPGMTPSAQERLRRVAPLNRLAVEVLEDGVHPGSMTREHFAVGLVPVLRTYGLRFRSRQM
jgi:hypothetical protein